MGEEQTAKIQALKYQTIYRVERKPRDYTLMGVYHLNDPNISFKCKGLLSYMFSRPDDWRLVRADLLNHATDGRDSISSALKEALAAGYCEYVEYRSKQTGRVLQTEYVFYERRHPDAQQKRIEYLPEISETRANPTGNGKAVTGEPVTGEPVTGEPDTGKADIGKADIGESAPIYNNSTYTDLTKTQTTSASGSERALLAHGDEEGCSEVYHNNPESENNTPAGAEPVDGKPITKKPVTKEKANHECPTPFILPEYIPKDVWAAYIATRNRKRAANTTFALNAVIEKLEGFRDRLDQNPVEVLKKSITSGWTDVFPLITNGGNGHGLARKEFSGRTSLLPGSSAGKEKNDTDYNVKHY